MEQADKVFEEAKSFHNINLYKRAAVQYTLLEHHDKAGDVYYQAAQLVDNSNYETALCFEKAGDSYRRGDLDKAKDCYLKAIKLFSENGNFSTTAKIYEKLAEINFENDNFDEVIKCYEKCHYFHDIGESRATAISFLLKAGYLLIDNGKYGQAIEHLQKCRDYYLKQSLTQFKAKSLNFEITALLIWIDKNNYTLMDKDDYNNDVFKFLSEIDNYIKSSNKDKFDQCYKEYFYIRMPTSSLIKVFDAIRQKLQ